MAVRHGDRWPTASSWARLSDDGLQAWRTSQEHRESRGYER